MDALHYLRKVIEERIRTLQAVRETAKPEHKQSYDTAIRTLEWVLWQFPRRHSNGLDREPPNAKGSPQDTQTS